MNKILSVLLLVLTLGLGRASNPCITMLYTADPSGHVLNNTLYVYCSHDRTDANGFDMTDYHVFSTTDLQNWRDNGMSFTVFDVPWTKGYLWAPDANFQDGIYYLTFPECGALGDNTHIGMATSNSPTGPFKAEPNPMPGTSGGGDPSLFMDNGVGYLVWTNSTKPKMVKLKHNLLEEDGPIVDVQGCDNIFEGAWIFKRLQTYYFTYPAYMQGGSALGGAGQWFDYATSDNVIGPYHYQGHFTGTRPNQGNIHGSQFEWNGKWYCMYHDFALSEGKAAHGFKRGFAIDEMQFAPDGKILPLKWTNEGPAQLKPIDAFALNDATCVNQTPLPEDPLVPSTESDPAGKAGAMDLGHLVSGGWVRYAGVDFGTGARSFTASVNGPAGGGGKMELYLDTLNGPLIGTCDVSTSGAGWTKVSCPVNGPSGTHFLYLKFTGSGSGELFKLSTYQFNK